MDGDLSKPRNKGRSNGDNQDKPTNLQQLLSSLFFGLLSQFDDRYNVSGSNPKETLLPQTNATTNDSSSSVYVDRVNDNEKDEAPSENEHNIEGVLDQIEKLIPHDPIILRQSTLYKSTLRRLHWQRDRDRKSVV